MPKALCDKQKELLIRISFEDISGKYNDLVHQIPIIEYNKFAFFEYT